VLAAIRDAESRVMFIGYNPLHYKLFIWTLSALLCGIAGALYVPQVGIINPGEMSPANSIEIAIWVAVGGRGTLIGPVIGAFIVNLAKSFFTMAFPEYWLFFLGALFVGVTLWLPDGVVGLWRKLREKARAGGCQMSGPSILLLHEVTVSFDGFRALNELSLDIEDITGELRCIIGPNGAGKTTMMDVITGKTRADRGKVMFDQNIDVRRMSEPEIAHLGIGRKFQKPTIFENLTVFENLELAR
jgi:urea transport system permease protein